MASGESDRARRLGVEFDEERIDAIFHDIDQCHLPGATVGIAVGGRPVYRKGFGLASMEAPLALTPSTRMRIYSITKHFTCLSYLLLCEDRLAGIDDLVGVHFPEFHPVNQQVTMRQLMGNISGLRDAHVLNFQFCGTDCAASSSETMALYRTLDDLNTQPGTTWMYNNAGFVLLSLAIERISGQSLGSFMQRRIFEPVGMHDTLLRRGDTDFVPRSAMMHMTTADGAFVKSYVGGDRSGTGGIVSTADDMLRWLAHMSAPEVGSAETWKLMRTPQMLASGSSSGYGCGLSIDSFRGVEMIHHPGVGMGANAQMLRVPSAGLDIMIMVNREDVSSWERSLRVLDACLPGLEKPRRPSTLPCVNGVFRSESTGLVIRLHAQGGMQLGAVGNYADTPYAEDDAGQLTPTESAFHCRKDAITLVGNREAPDAIRYSHYGNSDELVRVPSAHDPDISAIAGEYRCASTGFDVSISERGMRTKGRFGAVQYTLDCLARDIWRAKATSSLAPFLTGILAFDKSGFRFWSFGTWGLPFSRVAHR